jgi:hypothetical protein
MLTIHHVNAFLVIAVCACAGVAALIARRRGEASGWVAHLLALAQTLVVAQVLFGLLLLADHKRAPDRLHYAYGTFTLLAVFAPWLYAPAAPKARLLWFGGATLLAAALAVRAYMTG